mmetsp:Transcript_8267/g.16493  ORF Transcript_8267/g.16493 Transcript_8267/m.16493 type:complete len:298 (-) Transcript_8267:108-1001(-)|eukprot:CAMPEP_0171491970 /NCGR_PEP_ID=MMETSP0958-20121227/4153_1 /TAXON_ID=87120 /ORGANISM="Aurantiochytrium limacinum, Strain ATCCMYA-1381" /LENGTH=297 /DNA_ID=CAMNT_0012025443 /DNA_START=742 /DNA_END=1635 /DNA_ORIENTATION=-
MSLEICVKGLVRVQCRSEHEVALNFHWAELRKAMVCEDIKSCLQSEKLPAKAARFVPESANANWAFALAKVVVLLDADIDALEASKRLSCELYNKGFAAFASKSGWLRIVWRDDYALLRTNETEGALLKAKVKCLTGSNFFSKVWYPSQPRVSTSYHGTSCTIICKPGVVTLPPQSSWSERSDALERLVTSEEWNSLVSILANFVEELHKARNKPALSKETQEHIRKLFKRARVHIQTTSSSRFAVLLIFGKKRCPPIAPPECIPTASLEPSQSAIQQNVDEQGLPIALPVASSVDS